jgi:hypothetical protein
MMTIDPSVSLLWAKLYELDRNMEVSIDHAHFSFNLITKVNRELVTDILWWYNPVGIQATINGTQPDFSEHRRILLSE